MGLDIYLYSRAEHDASEAHYKGWDAWWEKWGEEPDGPEKEAAHDAIPKWSGSNDVPSENYPDHLFNRRYLRSSYNSSGFNRAVLDMLGRPSGLYEIFEPLIGDNPEPVAMNLAEAHIEALTQVKKNALAVAAELRDADPLRAESIHSPMLGAADHLWRELPSEDEVLAWYREERDRKAAQRAKEVAETDPGTLAKRDAFNDPDGGYSNAKGEVFGFAKGIEVLAITLGRNPLGEFSSQFARGTVGSIIGAMPQPVIVYRLGDEAKDSYIQSAEIVAEFCDEAINLIHKDGSCHMSWSG